MRCLTFLRDYNLFVNEGRFTPVNVQMFVQNHKGNTAPFAVMKGNVYEINLVMDLKYAYLKIS